MMLLSPHSGAERFGFQGHSPVAPPCFASPGQLASSAPTSPIAARAPHAATALSTAAWPTTTAQRRGTHSYSVRDGNLSRRNSALRHASYPGSRPTSMLLELTGSVLSGGSFADLLPPPPPAVGTAESDMMADPHWPPVARLVAASAHAGELAAMPTMAEPVHFPDILAHSLSTPAPSASARPRADAPFGVRRRGGGMFSLPAPRGPATNGEAPTAMRAQCETRTLSPLSDAMRLGTGRHASCAGSAATALTPGRRGSHTLLPFARTLDSLAAHLIASKAARTHAYGDVLECVPGPTLRKAASAQTRPAQPRAASFDAAFSITAGARRRSRPSLGDGALRRGTREPLPVPILFAALKPHAPTQAPRMWRSC